MRITKEAYTHPSGFSASARKDVVVDVSDGGVKVSHGARRLLLETAECRPQFGVGRVAREVERRLSTLRKLNDGEARQ